MKIIVSVFCITTIVLGIAIHRTSDHHPPRSLTVETPALPPNSEQSTKSVAPVKQETITTHSNTGNLPRTTTTREKKCACCRETSLRIKELVKKKRQELELWARETIVTYGYEEGMKRITAKSPILAQRIQQLLVEEKRSGQTHAVPQQLATPTR